MTTRGFSGSAYESYPALRLSQLSVIPGTTKAWLCTWHCYRSAIHGGMSGCGVVGL